MPCNETYTNTQKNTLLIVAGCNGCVSFCMCVVAVSLVFCLRLYKVFTYRLAMYQVLSGMMFSCAVMLFFGSINYDGDSLPYVVVCKAQAFLTQYFLWVKLLFTMNLIFHLFCLAVFMKNFRKLELFYILLSTLFPLSFTWIPFIHNNYGVAGAWCWIRDWKDNCASQHYLEGIIEQFALWYGPLFVSLTVCIAITVIIFLVVLWRVCVCTMLSSHQPLLENNLKQRQKEMLQELLPLLAYPTIFCCISLIPIVNRIYDAVSHSTSFELSLVHAITNYSMGLFSSAVLIMHVLIVRFYQRSISNRKTPVNNDNTPRGSTVRAVKGSTAGGASSSTVYLLPAESDVDKLFENIQ